METMQERTGAVAPALEDRPDFPRPWVILLVAALAMLGTFPGRTQGLGLITEPLLRDLQLDRVQYAQINLWATLIGALFCIGVGRLQDKVGSRLVLTVLAVLLGLVVVTMSGVSGLWPLFICITLTRGLGQSALSVVSLALVGQWYPKHRLDKAMAIYAVVMSMMFMVAFPVVGKVVEQSGWRVAWAGIGWFLLLVLGPLAFAFVRRPPTFLDEESRSATATTVNVLDAPIGFTLAAALRTPAFWVMALAAAVYGLVASGIGLFNESILKERGFTYELYYKNFLVVTALTSLVGNFLGGFLTSKGGMNRLMAVAMSLLMVGLVALPFVRTVPQVLVIAVLMGIAGGFVMVLFFSFWGRVYGRAHLGQIQGAAQSLTVLASAVGPLLLAEGVARTGSYATMFYWLAIVVGLLGVAAWLVRVPADRL